MRKINVRKRGRVYEYFFEGAKVNDKRTRISKSGFRTKNEAYLAGQKAYDEYVNGKNKKESQMSYSDYLDYWMNEYFEINYKYSTAKRYKETFKVLKEEIGKYNCYIKFSNNRLQFVFAYNEVTYVVKSPSYEDAVKIIKNLKENRK